VTVRTRLRLSIILLAVAKLGLIGVLAYAVTVVRSEMIEKLDADQVVRQVFQLSVLGLEYRENLDERPADQWRNTHRQLGRSLEDIAQRIDTVEEKEVLRQLSDNHRVLGALFDSLTSGRATSPEAERLIVQSLHLRQSVMVDEAAHLSVLSSGTIMAGGRSAVAALAAAILAALLVSAIILFASRRTITALSALRSGAEAVGLQDFTCRIPVTGDDEFSAVAVSMNRMADELSESYANLAREVEVRCQSERRYHSLFTNATAAMLLIDQTDGAIVDANAAASEFYGYGIERLKSMHIYDINVLGAESVSREMASARDRHGGHFYFRHRLASGEMRDVEVHSGPVEIADHILLLSIIHDITERRRAEEAQHRLNRELRAISNCNQVLMRAEDEQTLLDAICHIVCDEAGYRMAWVGYAEDDEAKTIRPVAWAGVETGYLEQAELSWADTERGRGPGGRAIRCGEASSQDFTTAPSSNPWRDAALRRGYRTGIALPLKDKTGNAFGALSIYSSEPDAFTADERRLLDELAGDLAFGITVLRTRAERKRLAQEREQYVRFFRLSVDPMCIADPYGCFKHVNPAFTRLTGFEESELLEKPFLEFVAPEDRQRTADEMKLQVTLRPTLHFENHYVCKDGRVVLLSWTAYFDKDDGVTYATASDITESRLAEDALREKTALLTQSNADLEQFAYISSHDLRTPLRNIVSYAQLLEHRYKGRIDADADDFIDFIVDNGKRMTQLIADLLEYSRITSQSKPSYPMPAGDAVARALANLRVDLDRAGAKVTVGDLPQVIAEPSHLVSVFQNLLGNGLKYHAPDREPRLSVTAERIAPDRWRFAVADNGVGIDPQYFDKIFEIFQRLDPASETEGTGIGLTLCRRIIHRFGGTIWVESTPGTGTTFFFTLMDGSTAESSLLAALSPPAHPAIGRVK